MRYHASHPPALVDYSISYNTHQADSSTTKNKFDFRINKNSS